MPYSDQCERLLELEEGMVTDQAWCVHTSMRAYARTEREPPSLFPRAAPTLLWSRHSFELWQLTRSLAYAQQGAMLAAGSH